MIMQPVLRDRETGFRDAKPDRVEKEEESVLAAKTRAGAVLPGPLSVGEVGECGSQGGRHRLRGEHLVMQGRRGGGQPVEHADVDDEGDGADTAEFGNLVAQMPEALVQRLHGAHVTTSRRPLEAALGLLPGYRPKCEDAGARRPGPVNP